MHIEDIANTGRLQRTQAAQLDVDLSKVSSAVLARLVEEVRNDEPSSIRAFDRVHNRHNR